MRIRLGWIAVPACAAAGGVSWSLVAAQEPAPPAGYYQTRVTPAGQQQPRYIRPNTTGKAPPPAPAPRGNGFDLSAPVVPLVPAAAAGTPPAGLPRPKITQPVVIGPATATAPPVRQVAGTEPPAPPPKFFPDVLPPVTGPAAPVPPPAATPAAPAIPPPRVFDPTPAENPKPLPLVPLPSDVPAAPAAPTPAPAATVPLPTFGPAPAPAPTPSAPAPAGAVMPVFPAAAAVALSSRAAPNVVLEAVAPESIGVGQNLTYELVVRNAGTSAVANVRVEDELPTGAKFVSSDPPADQGGGRLAWAVGTLDAGAEKRVKITLAAADEGEIRSRAVVTFSAAAEARVKITRPRVGVAVTAGETARVGDEVAFQIKVSNTGSGTAARVMVQARLSEGLHHPQGGVIEAELKDLGPGESKPITLRALATKAGAHACQITLTADGTPADPAKASVSVVEPLLTAKLTGPGRCLVRTEPEYKLELANPGTAATDPVQVWAVVPDGFEFVSAGDGTYQAANRTVGWRIANGLTPGGTQTYALKLRAVAPADGAVKIVAQAAADGKAGKVLEAKAEAAVKSEGVAALRFEVVDLDDPVEVGKDAVYEIKVLNQGTGPCTNVVVAAVLADGTTATGAAGATPGRGAGQQVTFDPLPSLAVKGEAVFRVRVKGTAAGDRKIRVQVSSDEIRTPIAKEENTRFYKD